MENKQIGLFYHVVLAIEPQEVTVPKLLPVALPDYLTIKGKALQCQILKVGVHQNHVHFVISIPPNFSIIKIINIIKENSFKYLKNNIKNVNFHWAKGFYISTISPTELQNTFKLFPVDNNIDDNVQLMEEVVNFLKI